MRTEALHGFVEQVFIQLGIPERAARVVSEALVAADLEGIASHGVMLVPMYVERMLAGSVSKNIEAVLISDNENAIVLDAGHALGQLTSTQATRLAVERARKHGFAAVAVRNGFHFGTAGYWARSIAAEGLIGIVMCNTRALMPAPGGAERLVCNNPLAIALPGDPEFVVDMAMSASAMGKIRLAAAEGKPIPQGWAADEQGKPTTDAAAAIKGMLLPAAGPKGFGLAAAIDLLCAGLSGGALADEVGLLYGDPARPYGCSHLFLALDAARFGATDFEDRVSRFSGKIRESRRAAGVERVFAPGDVERARRAENGDECPVSSDVMVKLRECGARLGVSLKGL